MMKEINKFILQILKFIPVVTVIYIFSIIIISEIPIQRIKPNITYRRGSYGHLLTRLNDIKNFKNVDLVFIGSSRCYRGFDNRIFSKNGIKSFNLGSSAQSPKQSFVLLKRHIKKLNPKTIILEVNPMTLSSSGVESSIDLIANDKNDILTITDLIDFNNIKTFNTAIVGFYKDFFNRNKNFTENHIKEKDTYISGGFVQKKTSFNTLTKENKKQIKIPENQLQKIKQIKQLANSINAALILVQAPVTKSLYDSYQNNEEFDSLMLNISTYTNYNTLQLDDSLDFYDSHHLNQNGVKKFNVKVIEDLKHK